MVHIAISGNYLINHLKMSAKFYADILCDLWRDINYAQGYG